MSDQYDYERKEIETFVGNGDRDKRGHTEILTLFRVFSWRNRAEAIALCETTRNAELVVEGLTLRDTIDELIETLNKESARSATLAGDVTKLDEVFNKERTRSANLTDDVRRLKETLENMKESMETPSDVIHKAFAP